MERVGIRELRNQSASVVRRAGAGERIVITVDGRPVAQIGPLEAPDADITLDDLIARGLVIAPRRADRPEPDMVMPLWAGTRLDTLVRGSRAVTLALDTTALLARYLDGPTRPVILDAMSADHDWCASAMALTEALMLVDRLGDDSARTDDLRRALRDDWERIHVIPVDQRCLDRAAELGRTQPLRSVDALHLAAADRLPRPTTFATFDPAQIPVAMGLGFDVVSTESTRIKRTT